MHERVRFCGIDIGSQNLKLVCRLDAAHGGGSAHMVSAVGPVSEPKAEPGADAEIAGQVPGPVAERCADAEAMGEVLSGLCRQTGLGMRWVPAAVSVPTSQLVVKVVRVPPLRPAERRAAFRLELERLLALAEGQVVGDYLPLAADTEHRGAQEGYLLLAAREQAVSACRTTMVRARLQAAAVEPEPAAQFRLARLLMAPEDDGPAVLVDLGAAGTRMLVVQRGQLLLFRDLPVGGSHLTAALARHLGVAEAEAERLKCTRLQGDGGHPALDAEAERLHKEIERSLRYIERERRLDGYSRLHLVGGGATWPFLRRLVERTVGIRAEEEVRMPSGPVEPHLAQAAALALWPQSEAAPQPDPRSVIGRVRRAVEGGLRR